MVKENIVVKHNKETILLDDFVRNFSRAQKTPKSKPSKHISRDSLDPAKYYTPEPTPVK